MNDYLRYSCTTLIYFPVVYAGLLLGGAWPWMALLFLTASQLLVDNYTAPDTRVVSLKYPAVLNLYLLHLPFGIGTLLLMLWQAAPGDVLGIDAFLSQLMGAWVLERHADVSVMELIVCGLLGGFALSSNTVVAHELVHRLSSPLCQHD